MSKFIDADEAIKEINSLTYPSSLVDVKRKLTTLPHIDIVRCKECKYWNTDGCWEGCGECEWAYYLTKPDDFCSYGERKESE